MYTHIHRSPIHNSQKVEITQMGISGRVYTHNVVDPYDGILFGHKRKGNMDICYGVDEPQKGYAKY